MTIAEYTVEEHDLEIRERKVCAGCGRRRIATRCTLRNAGTGEQLVRWFCNACMTSLR